MLKYLDSEEIDRIKWDKCIESSVANQLYGYSWYLDIVSPGWCAIVENDYKSVLPLPVKKKYGIKYIVQPPLTQQLGIFANEVSTYDKILSFIEVIPSFYKLIDINLNHSNDASGLSFKHGNKINYELKLSGIKDDLKKKYSENTNRNVQKAINEVEIFENITINEITGLIKENPVQKMNSGQFDWIKYFMEKIKERGNELLVGAYHNGVLCAAVFLIIFKKRIYFILPVSASTGKEKRAMFAILDYIIGKYSGSDMTLDFEGSNIEGVARFYKGFGASPISYSRIRIVQFPRIFEFFLKKKS